MNNKMNHYAAMLLFSSGLASFVIFVFNMSTYSLIGSFMGILFAMIYRNEYLAHEILMRLK
jgi:hypothetical protein